MSSIIRKYNPDLEQTTPRDRLQQIRMGAHDRLVAEAQLARAEALVDVVLSVVASVNAGLRALVVRPFRRITAAFS